MKVNPMKPVSRVLAGEVLVASIIRQGNGRSGSPVRWLVYWSPLAERMGAQPGLACASRYEAEAAAMLWASQRLANLAPAPRVERA